MWIAPELGRPIGNRRHNQRSDTKTKSPRNPNGPTLVTSNDTPVTPIKKKTASVKLAGDENPPVTFSPEKLAELLNMLTDQKAELAALKAKAFKGDKAVEIAKAIRSPRTKPRSSPCSG